MKKNIVYLITILALGMGLTDCKSNKISCPAYGDNKPPTGLPKGSKTRSGVLPSDGRGTRTKLPN